MRHDGKEGRLDVLRKSCLLSPLHSYPCLGDDWVYVRRRNISSELLLIEFPLEVVAGSTAVSFILGASFARGSFDDVDTFSLLHYPAEDTDETLFTFRLTEDMTGVDLLREELTVREIHPAKTH